MSSLEPRRRSRLSQTQRADRGGNLVIAALGSGAVFVVALILSIAGVISGSLAFLALIVTAVLAFAAYRTIKP